MTSPVRAEPATSCGDCLPVHSGWSFFANVHNPGFPRVDGDALVLLPDNRFSAAAAAWLDRPLDPPYQISFQYSVFADDAGENPWGAGNGLVLMIAKDIATYRAGRVGVPAGRSRGFIADGTGYGVHFNVFGPRQVALTDGDGGILATRMDNDAYTRGRYRRVRVQVRRDGVDVSVDERPALTWNGDLNSSHRMVGFGAASGTADGEHRVRNIRLLFPETFDET